MDTLAGAIERGSKFVTTKRACWSRPQTRSHLGHDIDTLPRAQNPKVFTTTGRIPAGQRQQVFAEVQDLPALQEYTGLIPQIAPETCNNY